MSNGSLLDYLRQGGGRTSVFIDHVDMAAQVGWTRNFTAKSAIWISPNKLKKYKLLQKKQTFALD